MFTFISNQEHRALKIWEGDKKIAQFVNAGAHGSFMTEDEEIANKLRKNRLFGIGFNEVVKGKVGETKSVQYIVPATPEDSVIEMVQDKRTSEPRVVEEKPDVSSYIRFGELKSLLIKPDGEFKKTASKELIDEYNNLKLKLGA